MLFVYAPVGEGCVVMKIYDDWITEIFMEPIPFGGGLYAFYESEIKNIFDNSSLNDAF